MSIAYELETIKLAKIIGRLLETDIEDKNGLLKIKQDADNLKVFEKAAKKRRLGEEEEKAMISLTAVINEILRGIENFPEEIKMFKKGGMITVNDVINKLAERN